VEVWQTSNLRRLRLGEEKKKEVTTGQKYIWSALLHRATINKCHTWNEQCKEEQDEMRPPRTHLHPCTGVDVR